MSGSISAKFQKKLALLKKNKEEKEFNEWFDKLQKDMKTILEKYKALNHKNLVDGAMSFPSNIEFKTHMDSSIEFSKESLMVLFTKHKITFKNQLTEKDIYDTIAAIPVHSRHIVYHNFEIVRR